MAAKKTAPKKPTPKRVRKLSPAPHQGSQTFNDWFKDFVARTKK